MLLTYFTYILIDNATAELVKVLKKPLEAAQNTILGYTSVYLQGDRSVCRVEECNMGEYFI